LEPTEIVAIGLESDDTYSILFLSPEELVQHPVALLKRQPRLPGETQRFDLFLYRKTEDIKEEGEKIPGQLEQSTKFQGKDGTAFRVLIPFSREDEYPFKIYINGENDSIIGAGKIANYKPSEHDGDVPVEEEGTGESSP